MKCAKCGTDNPTAECLHEMKGLCSANPKNRHPLTAEQKAPAASPGSRCHIGLSVDVLDCIGGFCVSGRDHLPLFRCLPLTSRFLAPAASSVLTPHLTHAGFNNYGNALLLKLESDA